MNERKHKIKTSGGTLADRKKALLLFFLIGASIWLLPEFSLAAPEDIPGAYSVILGGKNNSITGKYAVIANGENNSIGEGGDYSVIQNGKNITISGSHSWAMGKNLNVTGDNVFFWGYKDDTSAAATGPLTVSDSNVFILYHHPNPAAPEGAVSEVKWGIQTTNPQYTLDLSNDLNPQGGKSQAKTIIITSPASGLTQNLGLGSGIPTDPNPHICYPYYDLAELFAATETVEPGDVLVLAPSDSKDILVEKSRTAYDKKVIGIVSSAPAIVFEGDQIVSDFSLTKPTKRPPVALAGRVPCKVSLENGPIRAGDLLTTSSRTGHAMKADKDSQHIGTILGKALEPFDEAHSSPDGTGIIVVFVGLQ